MKENKDVEVNKIKNNKLKTKPDGGVDFTNIFLKNNELKPKEKK